MSQPKRVVRIDMITLDKLTPTRLKKLEALALIADQYSTDFDFDNDFEESNRSLGFEVKAIDAVSTQLFEENKLALDKHEGLDQAARELESISDSYSKAIRKRWANESKERNRFSRMVKSMVKEGAKLSLLAVRYFNDIVS